MILGNRGGGSPDLVHRVARRLAAARRERGVSQEQLAALLGIAVKNLQRMESGRQNLSLATVERVCAALDVSPESLFGEPTQPTPFSREPPPPRPAVLARLAEAGFTVRAATERGRRPAAAVPVTTLAAAAGGLAGGASAVETIGWALLARPAPAGQFIAEVKGQSMEPRIASGSLCLFGRPAPPPFGDRIVLVAHESLVDDDLGGPYALKRIKSAKKLRSGEMRIVLESMNSAFAPIVIKTRVRDEFRVIAELVRVLVTGAA